MSERSNYSAQSSSSLGVSGARGPWHCRAFCRPTAPCSHIDPLWAYTRGKRGLSREGQKSQAPGGDLACGCAWFKQAGFGAKSYLIRPTASLLSGEFWRGSWSPAAYLPKLVFLSWLHWRATSLDLSPLLRTPAEAAPGLGLDSALGMQSTCAPEVRLGQETEWCCMCHCSGVGEGTEASILKTLPGGSHAQPGSRNPGAGRKVLAVPQRHL